MIMPGERSDKCRYCDHPGAICIVSGCGLMHVTVTWACYGHADVVRMPRVCWCKRPVLEAAARYPSAEVPEWLSWNPGNWLAVLEGLVVADGDYAQDVANSIILGLPGVDIYRTEP